MKINKHLAPVLSLALLAGIAGVAQADECAWEVQANISPSDVQSGRDVENGWVSTWAITWSHTVDYHSIDARLWGVVSAATKSKTDTGSGNAVFIVRRIATCADPVEDIEAMARNQFRAYARLDSEETSMASGRMSIRASKVRSGKPGGGALHCESKGGVEATSSARESGQDAGTLTISADGLGVSFPLHWSTEESVQNIFQDSDSGAGGSSPETFTLQTKTRTKLKLGWLLHDCDAVIDDSKSNLLVFGTCDGACNTIQGVLYDLSGY